MAMKNPPHPSQSIKLDCLEPLGLSITQGARVLGVARSTLSIKTLKSRTVSLD